MDAALTWLKRLQKTARLAKIKRGKKRRGQYQVNDIETQIILLYWWCHFMPTSELPFGGQPCQYTVNLLRRTTAVNEMISFLRNSPWNSLLMKNEKERNTSCQYFHLPDSPFCRQRQVEAEMQFLRIFQTWSWQFSCAMFINLPGEFLSWILGRPGGVLLSKLDIFWQQHFLPAFQNL